MNNTSFGGNRDNREKITKIEWDNEHKYLIKFDESKMQDIENYSMTLDRCKKFT